MTDPLSEMVTLLQPGTPSSKIASGAGRWIVHRAESGRPFYCAILEGTCRFAVEGHEPLVLNTGDFVLIPSAFNFTASSIEPPRDKRDRHVALANGEIRHGNPNGPPDVRLLVGYCVFGSPDSSLLISLLPRVVLVRSDPRLSTLMQLVSDESHAQRPARDVVLARLLEVLLIEALRSTAGLAASPGLLRGLADDRLAAAIRKMHESPTNAWTVAQLAQEAGLSRSAFFDRFNRAVGVAPMEYLLGWRMALAKDLLRRKGNSVGEVAARVGYSSTSTFSVAFTRHVGRPPTQYARS